MVAANQGIVGSGGEGLPSTLTKRKVLHSKDSAPATLATLGNAFRAAGRTTDALAFYEKAGRLDEIESLGRDAVEQGDLFVFEACCRVLGREPGTQDLARLSERAESLGKLHFARKGFRLGGQEDKAQALDAPIAELIGGPKPEPAALADMVQNQVNIDEDS